MAIPLFPVTSGSGLFGLQFGERVHPGDLVIRRALEAKTGNIVLCEKQLFDNGVTCTKDFMDMDSHLVPVVNLKALKYSSWIALEFDGYGQADVMYNDLTMRNACDIVGICLVRNDACCVIARRTKVRQAISLSRIDHISRMMSFKCLDTQRNALNNLAISLLRAWLKVGVKYMTNFKIEEPTAITAATLLSQWASMTVEQCDWDIVECTEKVRLKRPRTDRDEYVTKMGALVLKAKKEGMNNISSYVCLAENANHIELMNFVHLDTLVRKSFDVITGNAISFFLPDWLTGKFYRQYTLCLHGDSDVGKTQLALSLLSELSYELQQKQALPPTSSRLARWTAAARCASRG